MNTLENLTQICVDFKEKRYDIEEFQSRLETLMVSDDLVSTLGKVIFDATNRLEEIRFCYLEDNFYSNGLDVVNSIMKIIREL